MRKSEVVRPFPPDYVSAETLAYRLDCSRSTIDDYARSGILPPPVLVGNLTRWDFEEVRARISRLNAHCDLTEGDPYIEGVRRAASSSS